jgi:hypothetical protein
MCETSAPSSSRVWSPCRVPSPSSPQLQTSALLLSSLWKGVRKLKLGLGLGFLLPLCGLSKLKTQQRVFTFCAIPCREKGGELTCAFCEFKECKIHCWILYLGIPVREKVIVARTPKLFIILWCQH